MSNTMKPLAPDSVLVSMFGAIVLGAIVASPCSSAGPVPLGHRVLDQIGGHAQIGDINGDGRKDIVIHHDWHLVWFEYPGVPTEAWKRHLVVTQLSMNNLDVADMDHDGDADIVTCEHSMPYGGQPAPGGEKLQIWENDGRGNFTPHTIDQGRESHLGAQVVDLDNDGDLDIVSTAWRDFENLHVWRNDAPRSEQSRNREP